MVGEEQIGRSSEPILLLPTEKSLPENTWRYFIPIWTKAFYHFIADSYYNTRNAGLLGAILALACRHLAPTMNPHPPGQELLEWLSKTTLWYCTMCKVPFDIHATDHGLG